ncbi:MAG: hypothetical protein ABEJ83_00895 [Candidatus Nanohaloarchaea archaeon]
MVILVVEYICGEDTGLERTVIGEVKHTDKEATFPKASENSWST